MTDAPSWILDVLDADARPIARVVLGHVPFRIGRRAGQDLVISSNEVSAQHAEIASDNNGLVLRDLGSRNGTRLRGVEVATGVQLALADVFQVGPVSIRLGHSAEQRPPVVEARPEPPTGREISAAFGALLEDAAVEPLFQPIVDLHTGQTVALEALGRGNAADLPQSPVELFRIAEAAGQARELARCFRQTALSAAHWARLRLPIFVNIHATELAAADFFDEIASIRARHPKLRLVLEVSEQYSTALPRLRALRAFLTQHEIGLSYDDFGAGLARIHELAEAPADFLKFDALTIRGLHRAAEPERRRVAALVAAGRALGMKLLAEGIESAPEAEACVQLGFDLGQGFLFGHPAPLVAPTRVS